MRAVLALCLVALLLCQLAACGASQNSPAADATAANMGFQPAAEDSPVPAATGGWPVLKRLAGQHAERLIVPRGLSPDQVVVRDLRQGTGPAIRRGDTFYSRYISFDYETEKAVEPYWGSSAGSLIWGTGERVPGWEPGLKGIRMGGLRELIVPSRLAYETGARVYLIEVTKIKTPAARR
jgi:hypothetical protein